MTANKLVTLIAVSVLVAILLASTLNNFTRVTDSALAQVSPLPLDGGGVSGGGSNAPRTSPGKNYLPIIFLNSAAAGGAWLLAGNAATNPASDFLGTTDKVTLTIRVSNTIAYRIAPAADPAFGFTPNIIGGSSVNTIGAGIYGATIGGGGVNGYANVITGTGFYATIGGGDHNNASSYYATIGGGEFNTASGGGGDPTVGGGFLNTASGAGGTVGGGWQNTASGDFAAISGGQGNFASGTQATIGGGKGNIASISYSTVGGGGFNKAGNQYATVGGGEENTASGNHATIPGGSFNSATMTYTFAAGNQARALHQGTFVWADSTNSPFASTANDQFLIRANGGVGINTTNPAANTLTVSGNGVRVATDGTTFARIQAGTATLGPGSGGVTNLYTITFPNAFATTPKVLATAHNGLFNGIPVDDTFAVTVRQISTTQFVVNIYRVDSNLAWGQNLQLDWFAWE